MDARRPAADDVIVVAAGAGSCVARFYSEPMNRWLLGNWRATPGKLASLIDQPEEAAAGGR